MKSKKIIFLTGTRADFGKLKPLMKALEQEKAFETHIFATGMHMLPKYGSTVDEVIKAGFKNIFSYYNQKTGNSMDAILGNTIHGFGDYVSATRPDLIIVHGDRVEALAGAVVGALNNIIVGHIEGGELSGTIDESIRHSISKLAHVHFVSNEEAKKRLLQMGEKKSNIYVIGSPDMDLMDSGYLPALSAVKKHYEIDFKEYALFIYHSVTTNLHDLSDNVRQVTKALASSGKKYIVLYPNNDSGSDIIIRELKLMSKNRNFRIFPSIRFESFLTLLKNCEFIIGNSSSGIREAPYYGIPSINIGNRQSGRFAYKTIINVRESAADITSAINKIPDVPKTPTTHFGDGKSVKRFISILNGSQIWCTEIQKQFCSEYHTDNKGMSGKKYIRR
ncbi:MAG: UDP-N-acetylglucosamine 2-epimerase [Candidatus Omnitrophota bacterium]|nr:UDP-N-acetylglucosamine 2-epimerase [Candidatus Omnitrophota bacterium]